MRSCRRLFSASVQGSFVRPGRQWCIHLIWQSSGERARLMWESVQMPCHASSSKASQSHPPLHCTNITASLHNPFRINAEAAEEGSGALDSIQPAVKLSKHQESSMVVLRKPPLHQSQSAQACCRSTASHISFWRELTQQGQAGGILKLTFCFFFCHDVAHAEARQQLLEQHLGFCALR